MSKRFIISDTHWGHPNVIKYERRPFTSLDEMDRALVRNWNKEVSKDDIVFHCGDFSFYSQEKTAKIINQLNGKIHLILGNHDRSHSVKWWQQVGIDRVYEYPILVDDWFWLSHEPMYLNENMPYANIHGHLHKMKMVSSGVDMINQHYNACVELIGFTPVNFEDIKLEIMRRSEI